MLIGFSAIVLFQLAGELIQNLGGLPVPGPVIGMALLLAALVCTGRLPDELDRIANGLLAYLPMLFVPAGVGIMVHFDLIKGQLLAITAAVVISSFLAIVATAVTMNAVEWTLQAIRDRFSYMVRHNTRLESGE